MIVKAAVKIYRPRRSEIILPVHRHEDARTIMSQFGYGSCSYAYKDGFLTDRGEFLDRAEAADHAYECGQLIETAEEPRIDRLMSEDLW